MIIDVGLVYAVIHVYVVFIIALEASRANHCVVLRQPQASLGTSLLVLGSLLKFA